MTSVHCQTEARASTGAEGLDCILHGGLPRGEVYLVEGTPGTGKTILAVQFLQAGLDAGEKALYISLSQDRQDLERSVVGAGLSLEGMEVRADLPQDGVSVLDNQRQVIFNTAHVELGETTRQLIDYVEESKPDRVVFDGIGFLRMLAGSEVIYRLQLLALRGYFENKGITVMLTNDRGMAPGDGELRSMVYGIIQLEQTVSEYGNERRRLRVLKLRGTRYESGTHDFTIGHGGLTVSPRVYEPTDPVPPSWQALPSGVDELDELLGGGLMRGTSCLMVGPSGTGKTSTATLYAVAAAERGENACIILFDELQSTFIRRSESIGMSVQKHIDSGRLQVFEIGTAQISPGQLLDLIRSQVNKRGVSVVLIDTLTGYLSAMPDERQLIAQMHDLLMYLSRSNVLTIVVVAEHGVVGTDVHGPVEVSYLADCVMLLRHFEAEGSVRHAVSVFKKRYGSHEKTIRQLIITEGGIRVSEPISQFTGVLSGTPSLTRNGAPEVEHP